MLHYMIEKDGHLQGWVLPDNPNATPTIKIFDKSGFVSELPANTLQADLRDRGLHETGLIGFVIDEQAFPGLNERINDLEFRSGESNILIYRRFQDQTHLNCKLFRFDFQAMPDTQAAGLFARRFALSYANAEKQPYDTMFGILNNQVATSLYMEGRPNYSRYEQLLRERGFKVITLLRDPYEELAERLLFMRFAASSKAPASVSNYTYGLEPLKDIVEKIRFEDAETLKAAFSNLDEKQRAALGNPLVRTLSCSGDDVPRSGHVEISLSKLSRMDLVGVRTRYDEFKSILTEVVGADILGAHKFPTIDWVKDAAKVLSETRQVRALLSIDVSLYTLVEEALGDALGDSDNPDKSSSAAGADAGTR